MIADELEPCPKCGKAVHKKATQCWHCHSVIVPAKVDGYTLAELTGGVYGYVG